MSDTRTSGGRNPNRRASDSVRRRPTRAGAQRTRSSGPVFDPSQPNIGHAEPAPGFWQGLAAGLQQAGEYFGLPHRAGSDVVQSFRGDPEAQRRIDTAFVPLDLPARALGAGLQSFGGGGNAGFDRLTDPQRRVADFFVDHPQGSDYLSYDVGAGLVDPLAAVGVARAGVRAGAAAADLGPSLSRSADLDEPVEALARGGPEFRGGTDPRSAEVMDALSGGRTATRSGYAGDPAVAARSMEAQRTADTVGGLRRSSPYEPPPQSGYRLQGAASDLQPAPRPVDDLTAAGPYRRRGDRMARTGESIYQTDAPVSARFDDPVMAAAMAGRGGGDNLPVLRGGDGLPVARGAGGDLVDTRPRPDHEFGHPFLRAEAGQRQLPPGPPRQPRQAASAAEPSVGATAAAEARSWADAGGAAGFAARRFGRDARAGRRAVRAERASRVPDTAAGRMVGRYRRIPRSVKVGAPATALAAYALGPGLAERFAGPEAAEPGEDRLFESIRTGQTDLAPNDARSAAVDAGQTAETADGSVAPAPVTALDVQTSHLDALAADVAADVAAEVEQLERQRSGIEALAQQNRDYALAEIERYRASQAQYYDELFAFYSRFEAADPQQVAQILAELNAERMQEMNQLDFARGAVGPAIEQWKFQQHQAIDSEIQMAKDEGEDRLNASTDRYFVTAATQSLGTERRDFWSGVDVGLVSETLSGYLSSPQLVEAPATRRVLEILRGVAGARGNPADVEPGVVMAGLVEALDADQVTGRVREGLLAAIEDLLFYMGDQVPHAA